MSTTITLQSLTKTFPTPVSRGGMKATTTAVNNISLTIEPGELFFLLGPSGCGKTTLLRMIAGFLEPTSGTIHFTPQHDPSRSRDVTFLPPNKRNTGMVFQSYALWPHMTVARNVAFGLEVRKVPAAERERRVKEALEAVRMGEYADRKPNQLSGGQQQRVALARALVIRPDVLLLDEPLSNLDAKLRVELRSEIRRICKQARSSDSAAAGAPATGITTIYVTHDQKEALSMADRVAIVHQGQIAQLGSPDELYRQPRSTFVAEFLGETNFLPATLAGQEGARTVVSTPIGRLVSAQSAEHVATLGQERSPNATATSPATRSYVVSIRPEAFRLATLDGTNTLFGRVAESVYLGETAQLTVELLNNTMVKVATLNPAAASRVGEKVALSIAPEDVVILPA